MPLLLDLCGSFCRCSPKGRLHLVVAAGAALLLGQLVCASARWFVNPALLCVPSAAGTCCLSAVAGLGAVSLVGCADCSFSPEGLNDCKGGSSAGWAGRVLAGDDAPSSKVGARSRLSVDGCFVCHLNVATMCFASASAS